MTTLHFDFEWRLTLFSAILLPLLIGLGFWQLERAEEKTRIAAQQAQRAALPAVPLSDLDARAEPHELAYRATEVSGHFHQSAVIYLDNQLRGGRYGVDVLGLFYDRGSDRWALLNRGWVPADPARRSLPDVPIPSGDMTLRASVYVPPGEPYTLAEEDYSALAWPLLVQDAGDAALHRALERELGGRLFPQVLRLGAAQPHGFRRDWPLVNSSPERHRAYALQWFTMAAALLLLFVLRCSNIAAVLRARMRG